MTRRIFILAWWLLGSFCWGQNASIEPERALLEFKESCWFTDELATALVFVEADEEPVASLPEETGDIRFFDFRVVPVNNDSRGNYAVIVEFMPQRTGVRTFPSIQLETRDKIWATPTRQFAVGEPRVVSEMSLSIKPAKQRVYAGEPLRMDFVWRCDLPLGQLRELRLYPDFFNDASITTVVPRSAAAEDDQFGLPVGGRRVIATRDRPQEASRPSLGEVRFSIFLRFDEAGSYSLPPTRLLCSRLLNQNAQSNQYAAYFNNNLFEPVDRSTLYEKLQAFSEQIELEVLPLPEKGRQESFSGLFSPNSIEVTIAPETLQVGQLMEIRVDVNSDACSEMLTLPPLFRQPNLRHRFWVGPDVNEIWRPDGRSFVVRARPLTVEAGFFPSLVFQVFNPESGAYETIRSKVLPLSVQPREGKTFFEIGSIPGARNLVVENSEGVWHNEKASIMNDVANGVIELLADGFWVFMLLGPVAFAITLPWVREYRRRALDELYGRRREAYRRFRSALASQKGGVESLRRFIAECFGRSASAMTARDAARLLRGARGDAALIEQVETLIQNTDAQRYDPRGDGDVAAENSKQLGERIFRLVVKGGTALCIAFFSLGSDPLMAMDWETAEASFAEALRVAEASADSETIEGGFAEAALNFEACGEAGIRSGLAWYNAGNAWFKAGEIGRAIANYRQAQAYRPFDPQVRENLEAARALRVDGFAVESSGNEMPLRWLLAALAVTWIAAWGCGLVWMRYRDRVSRGACLATFALSLYLAILLVVGKTSRGEEGVLIVDEAYGRKGPSYAYLSAYMDALHNGLEMRILEKRGNWLRVRIEEGLVCWLPSETVQILKP